MSGAAGAQATHASANRRTGIMSALTLLSVPASPIPGPPSGASGETASGFQALLAAETADGSGLPEEPSGSVAVSGKDDAPTGSPDSSGLLTVAVALPVSSPLPSPSESDPAIESPAAGAPGEAADAFSSATPAPAGQIRSAGAADPELQAGQSADRRPQAAGGETPVDPAAAAALAEADKATTRTGAGPVAAPPPMPAPLRPLAERASRPLEPPASGTGDAPREGDAASGKAAANAQAPAVTAPSAGGKDATAVAPAAAPASDGAAADFAPSGEGAAAEAEASPAVREAALSQLSRVTVEATAQIAAQILRRLEGRSTRFEMALTPDELGRVDVKLDIDSEGRLNARLAFDNPAAATDLRGRADELRRQLEDAGFHLGEDAFEFADRDSGSSAFDRGHDARNGQSRAFTAAARLNAEIDVAQPPRWMALSLSPAGVDMKV